MKLKNILILFSLLCLYKTSAENNLKANEIIIYLQNENLIDGINVSEEEFLSVDEKRPSPLFQLIQKKRAKNRKLAAVVMAFPFPFGIVGLHRIYMGCAPYVPIAYIASLGGVFGILPLIDFCVLLKNQNIEKFANSKKVFMWIDDETVKK